MPLARYSLAILLALVSLLTVPLSTTQAHVRATGLPTQQLNKQDIYDLAVSLGSADWTATLSENSILNVDLSSKSAAHFIYLLEETGGQIPQVASDCPRPKAFTGAEVGHLVLVDLDNDGLIEIVALVDFSGKREYDQVVVIHKRTARNFALQKLDVFGMASLKDACQDLDGDGALELIVRHRLSSPRVKRPVVSYPAVYTITSGDKYEQRSRKFASFYRKTVLPQLEEELAALKEFDVPILDIAGKVAERDKVLRIIGDRPFAGLAQAFGWSRHPDRPYRILAVAVLRDMLAEDLGNTNARRNLHELARDRDWEVQKEAKGALMHADPARYFFRAGDFYRW